VVVGTTATTASVMSSKPPQSTSKASSGADAMYFSTYPLAAISVFKVLLKGSETKVTSNF